MNLHLTNDPTLDLILVVAFTAMVATYFVPTMIAYIRQHERRAAILLVDLFLGWTFVGWWFALIWAIVGQREHVKPFVERNEPRLKGLSVSEGGVRRPQDVHRGEGSRSMAAAAPL